MFTGRRYVIGRHAMFEMERRRIPQSAVLDVLRGAEQRFDVRDGREVLQSRVELGGKLYLLRVFVDVDRDPPKVVTVYRTSKLRKYWKVMS